MKIDALLASGLKDAAVAAAQAEALGCEGVIVPEVAHDPFLPLALASAATRRVRLATGIAVAFARSPMTVAVTSSDLHRMSGGRFALGLGSQIRPHVTRRFSMPWSSPAPRMREFVAALRAIWASWEEQAPLDFQGEHYQHTLMTPMFSHGPSSCGWPSVHLAGVGPAMTELAGEVGDGLLCHGFTTADYLRDVTLPSFAAGVAKSGRDRSEVEVSLSLMLVLADDERDEAVARMRAQIAFYGSTPAYRPVLDHHGWTALGEELHALSKRGQWEQMTGIVDDEVLHTIALVGDSKEVAGKALARFGGLVDRIQVGTEHRNPQRMAEFIDALHAAG